MPTFEPGSKTKAGFSLAWKMTCHVNYQLQKTPSRRHKSGPESLKKVLHSSSNPSQGSRRWNTPSPHGYFCPSSPLITPSSGPRSPYSPRLPRMPPPRSLRWSCRTMQQDRHGSSRLQPPVGMDFGFSTQDVSVKASCPV